jgi:hypothetical protein
MTRRLKSIDYEPEGEPSMYSLWERDSYAAVTAPIAVRSAEYRDAVADMLAPHFRRGATLLSVGAGNGFAEVTLMERGWHVIASDRTPDSLMHCQAKGLQTARLDLLSDPPLGQFDAIYCDGVLGHLWEVDRGTTAAWLALATHARPGTVCLTSNDLADDSGGPCFRVRSDPDAGFYRPPAGWFAQEAVATGVWAQETDQLYRYERGGEWRCRELVLVRLLVNDWIVPEHRKQGRQRDSARTV